METLVLQNYATKMVNLDTHKISAAIKVVLATSMKQLYTLDSVLNMTDRRIGPLKGKKMAHMHWTRFSTRLAKFMTPQINLLSHEPELMGHKAGP